MTSGIGPNTPLRLARAAALAFPDGGMTEKGLRREHARGNLTIERVAGKDYTTLAYIDEMRLRCRLGASRRSSVEPRGQPTTGRTSGLNALLTDLNERKRRVMAERSRRRQL